MLIVKDDLTTGRSYSELSERFLGFAIKNIPNFKKYAVPFDDVKKKVGDEEIRRPDDDDPEVIRHPDLKDYYMREIGDGWHTKLMVGNVNAPNIQILKWQRSHTTAETSGDHPVTLITCV